LATDCLFSPVLKSQHLRNHQSKAQVCVFVYSSVPLPVIVILCGRNTLVVVVVVIVIVIVIRKKN
jgi:hypothetical protein